MFLLIIWDTPWPPKGDVISMAGEKEDIIIADIDKEEEYEYRKKFPVRNDFRPEIYKNL